LWEAVLPAEVLRLPEELARVDALLDDPVFFGPFLPFFDPRVGRGIDADGNLPADDVSEVPLRAWGTRACVVRSATRSPGGGSPRIPIDGNVPHPTTLMKLTTRCGIEAVQGCNEALLAKAAQAKLLRTTRLRADTTVVPADVAYPTDSGLLAEAVRRIAAGGRRVQAAGGGLHPFADRGRSAGKRAHGIAAKLRLRSAQGEEEAQATVRRITGELAWLAERAAADADAVAVQRPPSAVPRPGQSAGTRRIGG
jgi:transposase, IS5 family